jgi:hypothetical protein
MVIRILDRSHESEGKVAYSKEIVAESSEEDAYKKVINKKL